MTSVSPAFGRGVAFAKSVDTNCRAFQRAIDVLGRPWNGLILVLLQDGSLRFGELEDAAFRQVAESIHRWGSELVADEPATRPSGQAAGRPRA